MKLNAYIDAYTHNDRKRDDDFTVWMEACMAGAGAKQKKNTQKGKKKIS